MGKCSEVEQASGPPLVVAGQKSPRAVQDGEPGALQQEQVEQPRLDAVERGHHVKPSDRDVPLVKQRARHPGRDEVHVDTQS